MHLFINRYDSQKGPHQDYVVYEKTHLHDLETKVSLCPLSIEVPGAFSSIHVLYTLRF